MTDIHGTVAPGFEEVAAEFERNFAERGDEAASCAVEKDGQLVVDLWAGATPQGPWTPESRSVMFSVSKGITTICALIAAERGLLDLDERVAAYWPEYAQAGKEPTTVRQVLAHQAGLPVLEHRPTMSELREPSLIASRMAEQRPLWQPGASYLYHAITIGWLVGEILRRATGLGPREWLKEHVADPLGLAMTYGLSDSDAAAAHVPLMDPHPAVHPVHEAEAAPLSIPVVERAMSLNGLFDPLAMHRVVNAEGVLAAELAGVNLVATARSLARLYSATLAAVDGIRLLNDETIDDAIRLQSHGQTFIGTQEISRWGTGFMLPSARRPMVGPGSFGHDGAGGQLTFANRTHQLAFAYQTALPSNDLDDDRANALVRAVEASLGLPPSPQFLSNPTKEKKSHAR